ncbi:helix-turn-helix domain-containing protein [Tsukamurella sp. PLM1]|uniref:AraC family transcriptional regulator n=1 Tax=Tsukamurella sp. PLM1 TaxID=2929795 RepID=UPI0020C10046|nr:helix-turn-helix domain-containing protein [Tsukamurella sp. PLM1]
MPIESNGWADDRWEIAQPSRMRMPTGVSIAGFRDRRVVGHTDIPVLPRPAVTIVLGFGERDVAVHDTDGREHRGGVVGGLAPSGARIRGAGIGCVELRLSPAVARAALGVPVRELAGVSSAGDVLGPRTVDDVRERMSDARSWDERFRMALHLVARRIDQDHHRTDDEVTWVWNRISAHRGRVRIESLADEIGWSRKRLWSRFHDQIGLSPKYAARLIRFDHAAAQLITGQAPALVAAACGYSDQSHLHRDVRWFAGTTPTTLATRSDWAVDLLAHP